MVAMEKLAQPSCTGRIETILGELLMGLKYLALPKRTAGAAACCGSGLAMVSQRGPHTAFL